ncbi:hypothetical protein SERLA73DRAFT_107872 [Serpula lacrymans var. lacrymans S7.3]|uniref:Cyclin-like domain-containing protein n=2 Tax=Serpula lacrymans var. lacrymans TaxID=341189 RepID=F8PXZ3_SERL3|nr:uncharacterized protein SERLADRAFT_356043 [Serpula lacrymans var. lacrymans S7.9]EGN98756.1 hypothetical protein SERLA73DRAFT_107872 [Serpula lacrymans var. lacrymans S7.3]EGO24351.1 hypothetical protein SERLADRAFT_356043 [Serpula lacrymans var. lacrymans S7.9]
MATENLNISKDSTPAATSTTTATATVERKPLYEASTQYRNWRYSPAKLANVRASLNTAAVTAIRTKFEVDEPGSSSTVSFLDADEEQLLVKLYISKIPQLCGHFRFPEEVEATAISYLKRFYLKNTVMDWHPKNVMLTALFLASKTTNNPITLESYTTHIPRTSPSDVLDLEFLVAQSLGFEFAIWHAHRALWGIWLDLQSLLDAPADRPEEIYNTALGRVRSSRLTDVELIYTPPQIALACLSLASPDLALQWANSKFASPTSSPTSTPSPTSSALQTIVEAIKLVITQFGKPPDIESVREVDRRLRLCKNPEKVIGSKAYVARKTEEERRAEEKRNRKAQVARRAMDESDPFGTGISGREKGEKLETIDDDDDDDE